MKIWSKIKSLWYGWAFVHQVEYCPFFTYIEILLKYVNIQELPDGFVKQKDKTYILNDNNSLLSFGDEKRMEIFFGNLYVLIKNTEKDKVIRIFLKSPEINWNIWKEDEQQDHFKIKNEAIEIYRWYDVVVFDDGRCGNQMIKKGYWNEYASKQLNEMDSRISGMTIENRIKEDYRNLLKVKTGKSSQEKQDLLVEENKIG